MHQRAVGPLRSKCSVIHLSPHTELELRKHLNAGDFHFPTLSYISRQTNSRSAVEDTIGKLESKLSHKEDNFKNGLHTSAASVRELRATLINIWFNVRAIRGEHSGSKRNTMVHQCYTIVLCQSVVRH